MRKGGKTQEIEQRSEGVGVGEEGRKTKILSGLVIKGICMVY